MKEKKVKEEAVVNETVNEEKVNVEETVTEAGPSTEETTPGISVEQVKEISTRIDELKATRRKLEGKKTEFDAHLNDLENIKTVYGEESKQFTTKKELVAVTDEELKKLEDKVEELSFKRSELKPYLDAVTDMFDKERMAQASREYRVEVGSYKSFNQLLDFCYHSMQWTPKTAPALMTLTRNIEENKSFARSKDFDGVIILRSGNVLALQDFMTNKLEGKGWNTAKEFLMCWAECGRSIGETCKQIQKEYEVAREYATYLQNIDDEYERSENDIPEDEVQETTKEEVFAE